MKLVLKIIGGLVALLIVAAVAIPMFISADYLKTQLAAQVKQATGRTLDIKGKASLSVFPNIAVSVEDATLGNPEGFKSPFFAHVDKLSTGAALGPLLHKQLEITGIDLEGAVLHLEQNASGAQNWQFASTKTTPADPQASKTTPAKTSPLTGFALGDVTLKKSSISYEKAGAKPIALSDIDLTIEGADGSKPLKVDGSVVYNKETVKLKLGVDKMKEFLAGRTSPVDFSMALPATTASFKGNVAKTDVVKAEGNLALDISDTAKLTGWSMGKPMAGIPKKLSLKSGFFMQNEKAFALKDATVNADALSATTSLAIDLGGAVPALKGTIKIADLDADTLTGGSKSANPAPGAKEAAKSDGWSEAPLDLSGLRAVNADLGLTIGKLTSGKLELSNIAANVTINGGVAKLNLSNVSLYGGTAKGVLNADGSGSGAGVGLNMNLAGIQIEPLMTALTGASRVKGTANMGINVNGRGASQRALIGNLNGNGDVKITDGAIKGIDVANFIRNAKKGFVMGENTTESTDFTALTASYKITQGILSNDDLSMLSPILRLTGKGTVNLPQRSINYRAVPSIVSSIKGQGGKADTGGLDIPLIISGPWSAISVTPDLAGMVQGALKDPAALKQNLQDLKEGYGKLNSPKDIGKALFGGKQAAPAAAPDAAAPATTAPVPATTTAPATDATPAPAKKQKVKVGDILKGFGN